MAWNEQFARVLEQMKKGSVTSTAITGVESKDDEPDCIFYSNFSQETAMAFYDVFENFKDYYKSNPSFAVDRLKQNLKMQMDMMGEVCPIEVLLYSSRVIRDLLKNRAIKGAVISVIQQYIPNNLTSVKYILGGWEWPHILAIVIEACGKTNDKQSIKTAMDYFKRISTKFVDKNDNDLMKSYLTMIESTQNEEYLHYLNQIVASEPFDQDNALAEHFIQELKRNKFFMQNKEFIANQIISKTNNFTLKRALEKLADGSKDVEPRVNSFNMSGLNTEIKAKKIATIDFSVNSSSKLVDFERSRETDNEIILLTCKKILKDISEMRQSDRNLALILVGTKGSRIRAYELIDEIITIIEKFPELSITGNLALSEIDQGKYPLEKSLKLILEEKDSSDWEWSVGKYFRFRKLLFEKHMLRAISDKINRIDTDYAFLLTRFLKLLEIFNGYNELLSTQQTIVQESIDILNNSIAHISNETEYIKLLEILDYLLQYSPEEVLIVLDKIKLSATSSGYSKVITKANDIIKKGDLAREPD